MFNKKLLKTDTDLQIEQFFNNKFLFFSQVDSTIENLVKFCDVKYLF